MNTPVPADVPAPAGALRARRLVLASLTALLVGVVAGLVWVWLANPAQWEVRDTGIVLTEAAARGQFSVIVVFVVIGAVVSTACGGLIGRVLPDVGWLVTPLVVVLTSVAAVVAWRVGVELGPPPPESVTGVSVGDRIPAELAVDGIAAFVVWPIFGLVGVIGATWAAGRRGASGH